jgi:hypothetical protein
MIFYSLKEGENGSALQELIDSESYSPAISYERIGPTDYKVHIKTEQPFFLLFSEAYNPFWRVQFADGQELQPRIGYSIINSFYVNRTGEFDVKVYFGGQTYADMGLKISLFSLVAVTVVVLIPRSLIDRLKKQARFAKRIRKGCEEDKLSVNGNVST